MTCTVKFVTVTVCESHTRLNNREVNIEIAVFVLIFFNFINAYLHLFLKVGVILFL